MLNVFFWIVLYISLNKSFYKALYKQNVAIIAGERRYMHLLLEFTLVPDAHAKIILSCIATISRACKKYYV